MVKIKIPVAKNSENRARTSLRLKSGRIFMMVLFFDSEKCVVTQMLEIASVGDDWSIPCAPNGRDGSLHRDMHLIGTILKRTNNPVDQLYRVSSL